MPSALPPFDRLAPPRAVPVPAEPGPNDRRLRRLADEWVVLCREVDRIAAISGRRWGCDGEHGPLATRFNAALRRQDAIAETMRAIPADTPTGADAKLRLTAYLDAPAPGGAPAHRVAASGAWELAHLVTAHAPEPPNQPAGPTQRG